MSDFMLSYVYKQIVAESVELQPYCMQTCVGIDSVEEGAL